MGKLLHFLQFSPTKNHFVKVCKSLCPSFRSGLGLVITSWKLQLFSRLMDGFWESMGNPPYCLVYPLKHHRQLVLCLMVSADVAPAMYSKDFKFETWTSFQVHKFWHWASRYWIANVLVIMVSDDLYIAWHNIIPFSRLQCQSLTRLNRESIKASLCHIWLTLECKRNDAITDHASYQKIPIYYIISFIWWTQKTAITFKNSVKLDLNLLLLLYGWSNHRPMLPLFLFPLLRESQSIS